MMPQGGGGTGSQAAARWRSTSRSRALRVSPELGQHAAQAEGFVAEARPGPVIAGGRGVALVEDQVDDLEHRREPGGALAGRRDLERNLVAGQGLLGADDPLGESSRWMASSSRPTTGSARGSARR